ncbi:Sialyltransferase PMO188 [Actinobacillus equuli]|nr:Sialyltransferase PMO188 [Actinobacillus equuli]
MADIHAILIREHLDPNSQLFIGKPYLFVFKGHPNSPEINQALREYYSDVIFYLTIFRLKYWRYSVLCRRKLVDLRVHYM